MTGDGRLVALGIGGRAAGRKWPLERYAECIARLNEQRPVQPVIVCSADEDAEASALSVKLAVPPYILSGVPLRTVCAVLERCDLFLGNDTGTAHLAAAMNCPTVVVSRHPRTAIRRIRIVRCVLRRDAHDFAWCNRMTGKGECVARAGSRSRIAFCKSRSNR